jgi:hypothetical protein
VLRVLPHEVLRAVRLGLLRASMPIMPRVDFSLKSSNCADPAQQKNREPGDVIFGRSTGK